MTIIKCTVCGEEAERLRSAKYCFSCSFKKIQLDERDRLKKYPLATKAHQAVSRAIKRGLIKKAAVYDCVDCGVQAQVYDHRDYRKPLVIEPVCRRCNLRRGKADPYK